MKSICISHKEDVDGIVSAALLQNALKVRNIFLVDYPNLLNSLDYTISLCQKNRKFSRVFICDVGLNKKNQTFFIDKLKILLLRNVEVIYIDHHYLEKEIRRELELIGVKLIHDINDCTSVQIYYLLRAKLSSTFAFYAAAAALTDYMESNPKASLLVSKYDRTFLMLEACFLSYIISSSQKNIDFLKFISRAISKGKMPHDIKNGFRLVREFCEKINKAIIIVEEESKHLSNISYFEHNLELSSSMIVNFVLGITGKKVGIAFKLKSNINSYILSIRGSKECKTHLGILVNNLSAELNGSGGGHDKACGAVIPTENFKQFLDKLDQAIV
ncbi:MAG TPA: DHH family phosphoesterase [Candidatus Nitrosocosmicus sp.]|nr:DHH family phosphoesterase [Candidatus Nitrosocosmicus sp.]